MQRFRVFTTVGRDRRLRRLVVGLLGFSVAEAATWLAILVYAQQRGGATEAGLVALSQLVPPGLVAPLTGFAADRFDRHRVLAAGSALQAVALAATGWAMAADAGPLAVYGCGALATSAMTVSRPATWALFPWVTSRPEQLTAANVAGSLAESTGLLAGPAIAALLLLRSDPSLVFLTMAVLMGGVTVLALFVRTDRRTRRPAAPMSARDVWLELSDGVRVIRRTGTGAMLGYLGAGFVLLGAVDVLAVVTADEILGADESAAGLLATATGAGAVVGATGSVLLVGQARLVAPLLAASALAGLPVAATAAVSVLIVAVGLFALNGVGAQVTETVGKTMIQRATTDDVLARVFGLVESLTVLAMAVGAATVALLASWLGPRPALLVAGLFLPVIGLVMGRRLNAIDLAAAPPDPERIDALLAVPMFEPLANPVVEQLALNMRRDRLPAGAVLIAQGAPGDHLYLIAAGELEVRRDGRIVGEITAGDHVGEVALLRGEPRNATVVARTTSEVWAIDGDVFVEAVTGHPQSLVRAEAVADRRGRPTRIPRPPPHRP